MSKRATLYCDEPGCDDSTGEVVNGVLRWRIRHHGEWHWQTISIDDLYEMLRRSQRPTDHVTDRHIDAAQCSV